MRKAWILLALFVATPVLAQDASGCKDDPLFTVRMPKYRIERCESKPFASYDFALAKPPRRTVEGALTFITYAVDRREDDRSGVEVIRNYENAIRKIGGRIEASDPQRWITGVVTTAGRETWVQVEKGNGKIWLRIVRKQEMQQIVVADAAALANDLKTSGHVTVNGIYFDTNKAALKPESAAAVAEIAKLLKSDGGLKVYVVGHTDSVGSVDANLKLSHDRAQSVLDALVRDGVAAARLRSFGNGPFAPVATNATDDGRALNRRVELVKQ